MADAQNGSHPLMSGSYAVATPSQQAPTITIHHSLADQETSLNSDPRPLWLSSTHSSTATPSSPSLLDIQDRRSRQNSLDDPHSVSSYGGDTLGPNSTTSEYGQKVPGEIGEFSGMFEPDVLDPDPGEEYLFHVEDNPFAFTPGHLSKLFNEKSIAAFWAVGGLQGLVRGLRTDSSSGLSLDETNLDGRVTFDDVRAFPDPGLLHSRTSSLASLIHPVPSPRVRHLSSERYVDRRRVFGENRLPEKKTKGILEIMWITFNDKVLIILTIVAAISLALGLYQDFGSGQPEEGPRVRWVEGVTIMVAVVIVVVVGSLNDHQKERQFIKLNKTKEDRVVKAIRSGKSMEISIYDILAGDVLHIEPGDMIPVDGVFISGHNVMCDESSATGESDQMKKTPGNEVMAQVNAGGDLHKLDPFIISGSKVLEGVGTYLVTGVGVHSSHGKLMMSFTPETEPTPLQTKLNKLAEDISKIGCAIALLLFIVLFIRFLVQLKGNEGTPYQKGQEFLQIVIVSITIIVIAVPEGLPLAVILALAFAVTRMLKDNNLVRVLRACEAMGNITTVCTDKTGTLTLNKMTLVAGTLSTGFRFVDGMDALDQNQRRGAEGDVESDLFDPVPISTLASRLSAEIRKLLSQSIVINSTAFEGEEDGKMTFIGSKTETALLSFADMFLATRPVKQDRANVIQLVPFDSQRKCMASVIKISDLHYRMFVKGAPEVLLRKCTHLVANVTEPLKVRELTGSDLESLTHTIDMYASRSLRTLGMVYRDFNHWPPPEASISPDNPNEAVFEDVFQGMVFLGVVGIRDPVRPGVKKAVAQCQHAGVYVRMVTGDSINTAVAVAKECGILTQGGLVMEGREFRKLSSEEMERVIPNLQVLARSSPEDKRILVKNLKDLGETVAVTGDGTNDGPALKTADVGFSMGSGTEVAKEASSIVLIDDNFASIVKALAWGRTINDAVKKFLQFQLTVNVTAVVLTFVSAIASDKEEPILTPVQLLWVNLIMDTFAALALATDPPAPSILDRKPDPRSTPLVTLTMWKMIIGQSIYQLAVTLTLNFAGNEILGYKTEEEKNNLETLIFNVYVWMQLFNQFNNRRLDNKFNIFEGILRNYFFIGINVIIVSGQLFIVFFGGDALSTEPLNAVQWGISLLLGAISLVVAVIIRLVPDALIRKLWHTVFGRTQAPSTKKPRNNNRFKWNSSIETVRDQLAFFKTIRGRRFNGFFTSQEGPQTLLPPFSEDILSQSSDSRSPSPRRRGSSMLGSAVAPATVMAGVIAGSIAGWNPRDLNSEEEDLIDAS